MSVAQNLVEWFGDPIRAHRAVAALAGAATVQQCLELLAIRDATSMRGPWAWSGLRNRFERAPVPLRRVLEVLMDGTGLDALLMVTALLAASVAVAPNGITLGLCLLTTLLMALRFRGSVNGGTDSMTLLALLVAWLGALAGPGSLIGIAALWYLGIQSLASYALAGVVKLRSPAWRQGKALSHHIRYTAVGPGPAPLRRLVGSPGAGRLICWTIIVFELSAPIWILIPRLTPSFVALAVCFHLGNAWLLGLHRFTLPWLASHAALFFLASSL